ncbi:MAG: glycoside hydrolase family 3 C-terminal domain-containing protein, partial [Candidatus Acidiferrales bacterium]
LCPSLCGVFAFAPFVSKNQSHSTSRPWMNAKLSPDERADLLVKQMTLDEKIQLLHGFFGAPLGKLVPTAPPRALGGDGFVPGIPRLGIPDLNLIGAGLGVTDLGHRANGQSTELPSSLAETSSWDLEIAYAAGKVIGEETRAEGFNVSLGGGIDVTREPRNGRNFEYHGENPLLAGKITGQELRAIQDQGVVADIKHYVINDQESGRFTVSSNLDKRSMREIDLLAFEIAIKDSGVGTVMCAYNRVNDVYSCENDYLLNEVLKKDWGFRGWVMSDCGATHSTVKAANAGLDQEFFLSQYFSAPLKEAVEKGEVPMARLDDMVHRILRTLFTVGVMDHPPVVTPINVEKDADIAQHIEEQGAVLLKNADGQLPLDASKVRSIAVIGSHADIAVLSGGGSAQVNPVGGNAVPAKPVADDDTDAFLAIRVWDPSSPLRAIRAKSPQSKVVFALGLDAGAAAKLASDSEVAIVFAHQHTHENADLKSLALPDEQDELIRRVVAANAHTIVVLENGDPLLMPWLDSVKAVLETWYPGPRGGEAIANILFGDVNPSGKLVLSFPKSEADLPRPVLQGPPAPPAGQKPDANVLTRDTFFDVNYSEGMKVGYCWYDAENKEPLFPFGFGLSYSSFAYTKLRVDSARPVSVAFSLKNTSQRAGAEVAQVYLGLPTSAGEPPKRLVGWKKVKLDPGETQEVNVSIAARSLAIFDDARNLWEIVPGEYRVFVGGSSRETPLTQTFRIDPAQAAVLLEQN